MSTANNTRQISKLQAEKSRLLARIAQIDAEIDVLIQAAELAEAVQEVLTTTPSTRQNQAQERQHSATPWIEERMINGCGPYYYRRWWDGNKRRSEYLGKTKPA